MSFSEEEVRRWYDRMVELPIIAAALARLENELSPDYYYHSLAHTKDVFTEVLRFALHDQLTEREIELLAVGAAYHDLGFLDKPVDNEWTGARYARAAMESFGGYSEAEIQSVEDMILDTQLVETALGATQLPSDKLAKYLLDADLGNLGRDDFFDCAERLQREIGVDKELFFPEALRLIKTHNWLTPAAEKLRAAGQQQNVVQLEKYIESGGGDFGVDAEGSAVGLDLSQLLLLAKLPLLLNSSLNLAKVCESAMGHLSSMTCAEAATVFLLDKSGSELMFWAVAGGKSEELRHKRMPADRGIVGWVIQNRQSLRLDNVKEDERFYSSIDQSNSFETTELMCVPLTVRGSEIIGAVQVLNRKGEGVFSAGDLFFTEQFSHQLALAIDNAKLFDESEQMRQMLEQLDRRKAEMIAVITHEFRTPLNVIQTSADLLASADLASSDMQEKIGEALVSGVSQLTKLTAQIQSLSQFQGAEVVLRKERLPVAELLREVHTAFLAPAKGRNIEFTAELDNSAHVEGDRALLYMVLSGFVANAIRFTPDGGTVSLAASTENDLVTFAVADTGIGIPPSEHALVFEKFYEVGDSMEHSSGDFQFRSGGLGLGLATAQAIIREHGASIELESEEGSGSTFCFRLPVAE